MRPTKGMLLPKAELIKNMVMTCRGMCRELTKTLNVKAGINKISRGKTTWFNHNIFSEKNQPDQQNIILCS